LIAGKACDSNWIVEDMNERKAKIVISQYLRRSKPPDIDMDVYKGRHLIENFSQGIQPHRIAQRKNRYKFRGNDPSCLRGHQLQMNLNRPLGHERFKMNRSWSPCICFIV
jgi:hypothetical protein